MLLGKRSSSDMLQMSSDAARTALQLPTLKRSKTEGVQTGDLASLFGAAPQPVTAGLQGLQGLLASLKPGAGTGGANLPAGIHGLGGLGLSQAPAAPQQPLPQKQSDTSTLLELLLVLQKQQQEQQRKQQEQQLASFAALLAMTSAPPAPMMQQQQQPKPTATSSSSSKLGESSAHVAAAALPSRRVRHKAQRSSKHPNVLWQRNTRQWEVRARVGNSERVLGSFATESRAVEFARSTCGGLSAPSSPRPSPDAAGSSPMVVPSPSPTGSALDAKERSATSSKYRGVCWNKCNKSWKASIKINGKNTHIGYFDDVHEAALAYDLKALEVRGDRAVLNFKHPVTGVPALRLP